MNGVIRVHSIKIRRLRITQSIIISLCHAVSTYCLTLKVPEKLQLYWTLCVLCGAYLRLWHVKS